MEKWHATPCKTEHSSKRSIADFLLLPLRRHCHVINDTQLANRQKRPQASPLLPVLTRDREIMSRLEEQSLGSLFKLFFREPSR